MSDTMTRVEHERAAEYLLAEADQLDVPNAGPKRAEALRDMNILLQRALVHATLACVTQQ